MIDDQNSPGQRAFSKSAPAADIRLLGGRESSWLKFASGIAHMWNRKKGNDGAPRLELEFFAKRASHIPLRIHLKIPTPSFSESYNRRELSPRWIALRESVRCDRWDEPDFTPIDSNFFFSTPRVTAHCSISEIVTLTRESLFLN